jgi:thiol-disulfide isomerase/thioredoxin
MSKNFFFLMIVALIVGGGIYWFSQNQQAPGSVDTAVVEGQITGGIETRADGESSRYISYSKKNYDQNAGKKRVLFFHAVWCPTCKVANEEFNNNLNKIPEDVILLKTDYDTEKELKQKYNITYQHTFVLVDNQGNELKKWNGGGIEELISNSQ